MPSPRYVPNRPAVIDETIDGEVVVIDLATGNYFSLVDSAAVLWAALAERPTAAELVARVTRAYGVDAAEVAGLVEGFLADLVAEGLVVEVEGEPGPPAADPPAPVPARQPFRAPRIEKFDDMQELILLDPVHDVDRDLGWPRMRAAE